MKLAVVTATLDLARAASCVASWTGQAAGEVSLYFVAQAAPTTPPVEIWDCIAGMPGLGTFNGWKTPKILGVVPAFAVGVQKALEDGADLICCFHDDLEIQEHGWDLRVQQLFLDHPQAGLCGFGGGRGLGAADIYQAPYNPMQLARQDFISNMRDAEAHGRRVEIPTRVACLDGFSQIGTRAFWQGQDARDAEALPQTFNLFDVMAKLGVVHHCYDSMLGCYAARLGYEAWMLPVKCHHLGGVTAAGDPRYQAWATDQRKGATINGDPATGDQIFWREAHRVGYHEFRDVLPLVPHD